LYEFHGWFGIAESPEEADGGSLSDGIADLKERVSIIEWATGSAEVRIYNGQSFLLINGLINRRRDEAEEVDILVRYVADRFPGAWGILYERSDDFDFPPGPGAFRVRIVARGEISIRLDPFLSPTQPVIED
jgi:hypothetical protein